MGEHKTVIIHTILGFVTLLNCALSDQTTVLRWKILYSPSNEMLTLVKAESVDNYWVSDVKGKLFHLYKGQWTTIKTIHVENAYVYTYSVLNENFILCSVMDVDYHTHYFTYDGEKWDKHDLVVDVPVRNLFIVSEDDFWAFGDWGHIYHYQNNKWERIEAPITNHIACMEFFSNDDIWFGTRVEGIFHYDGLGFTKIEIDGYTKEDIFKIIFFDSQSGLAAGNNGNIYQYQGKRFTLINTELTGQSYVSLDFYDKNLGLARSGKGELYVFENGHWTKATLPTNLFLASVKLVSQESALLTCEKGIILVAQPEQRLFFTNTAGRSYVDGSSFDKSIGAAFADVNNDNLLDLFVLNGGYDQIDRLYLNQPNTSFIDVTNQSKFQQSSQSNLFTLGDFNKDGWIDYAFLSDRPPDYPLKLFYNSGNGWFDSPIVTSIDPMGNSAPVDLDAGDFDNDGNLDLYLSFYYGPEKKAANNLMLVKKTWGQFSQADSSSGFHSPGWNRLALYADFNNDDWLDLYVSNYWGEDKLLVNQGGIFTDATDDWFENQEVSNTTGAAAVDFDNDGDLDLFQVSLTNNLTIYRNESCSYFRDVTKDVGFQFDYPYSPSKESINFGDFNNDGFVDMFISNLDHQGNYNWLFLNDSGKTFVDFSAGSGIESPIVYGAIVGDVDNDGDLDIYGYRDGSNQLWSNQLNDNNYLEIDTRGVGSNRTGLGNKIWVYDAGHLDDIQFLKGYRQVGTENIESNMSNSTIVHFGLDSDKTYDVKIQFQGGKRKLITNVSPGQKLVVYELEGLAKFLTLSPGFLFRTVASSSFQLYSLIISICIIMILVTIRIGKDRYEWSMSVISGVIILNLSAFWILVLLTNKGSYFLKYMLPLAPVLLGTVIPVIISHRIKIFREQYLKDSYVQNELLQQLLIFAHGEWAMKNLNGIQLFSENVLGKEILEEQLIKQLDRRVRTFLEITTSNLEIIIDLGRKANIENEIITNLEKNNRYIATSLETIRKTNYGNYPYRLENYKRIAIATNQIKLDLIQVKNLVFSAFSSNVEDVIINTTNSLAELVTEKGVVLKRVKTNIDNLPVLIPNHELASILDNSIRNAITAINDRATKVITIRVYRYPPAVRIDIEDTGIGIPQKDWDRVFESGFSGFGSTGNGLTQAQDLLSKYGGRIFIKDSRVGKGSTFTIELKEGVK